MAKSGVDCVFFHPPIAGGGPARCSISGDHTGQTALFCHRCEVTWIRAGPYCRHLQFGARLRTGLIGEARVKALLRCGLHDGRKIRLSDCRRCPDYKETE